MTAPKKRTATGARLVDVHEIDRVDERGRARDELTAWYHEQSDAAYADYRAEVKAAEQRWAERKAGLAAEYDSRAEQIDSHADYIGDAAVTSQDRDA